MRERVDHPRHYNMGAIETSEFIDQVCAHYPRSDLAYAVGNVLKYLARAPHKGAMPEDLEKARWYLDHAIQILERKSKP
jgi:Protein of unknwon function (DUF3310)